MDKLAELELKIAKFLRYGVVVAAVFILGGWLLGIKFVQDPFYLFQHYDPIPFQRLMMMYYKNGKYGAIIAYAGLIMLIALPLIRVFLTGCLFLRQKDFKMGALAFLVLFGLILSFGLGLEL